MSNKFPSFSSLTLIINGMWWNGTGGTSRNNGVLDQNEDQSDVGLVAIDLLTSPIKYY